MTIRFAPFALAAALGLAVSLASAQSHPGAYRPTSKAVDEMATSLRAPAAGALAARIRLAPPEAGEIATLKAANARTRLKRLDIGIGRDVSGAAERGAGALNWITLANGRAAHWEVTSAEARALRVALRFDRLPAGLELRFAGNAQPGLVYGPYTAMDVAAAGAAYWSPVLEGDTATVELFLPGATSPGEIEASVASLSHLFVSPADPKAEALAKAAGLCEVNFVCLAGSDTGLAQTGSAVARMSFINENGGSSLCSGTLLNPNDGSFAPYFYSAAHCFSTPSSAATLTTHWFYESSSCSANTLSAAYVQRSGGAVLLYANEATDVLFVRLNTLPPPSVFYAGWDAATVARGAPVTAIHHPEGDLKKISLGAITGFDASSLASGNFIRVQWNSTATGVTEPGSSGSAIFTGSGSGMRVRGGLLGGDSSCSATTINLWDVYSRFDLAYPFIAQHLAPSAAPVLGSNAVLNAGFESGASSWTQSPADIVTNDALLSRTGAWHAWLGGADNSTDSLYQALPVPAGTARLQFWYRISTAETTASQRFDILTIAVADSASGAVLQELGTLSNLDSSTGWVQSPVYDVSQFGNRTVRLLFRVAGDSSLPTSFRIDDVTLNGTVVTAAGNQTALWYNPTESGWGINVNQQGDIAFATLFTYNNLGSPMWLVMPAGARQGGANTFMGTLYRTTGPAFNANPFTPIGPGNITEIGSMTVDFNGPSAVLGYDLFGAYVSKSIQKQVFGAAGASCQGTAGSRAGATNYQDLWWNPNESGWGINLTHQGNIIFGTLFTYAANGQGLWLVMDRGERQGDGSFLGPLYRTNGPSFNAQPWTGIGVEPVGSMRLRFQNGETGTLEYTVDGGAPVIKAIQRQVFSSPAPVCSG